MKTLRFVLLCLLLAMTASALTAAKKPSASPQWWGRAPGQKPAVNGEVANVSPTNIAVKTREGVKPFVVNDKTRVMVRGQRVTINDVKVGDLVHVKFKLVPNNVPLALAIVVPKPAVRGKIVAIEGAVVVLKNKEREVRVTTTEQTKYRSRGYEGVFADLRIGYWAAAQGTITDQSTVADVIEFKPAMANGAVIAKEGDVITVKTVKQLTIVTLGSAATAVLIRPRIGPNKKGTLADIQVGMPCDIGFHANPQGQSPLLWIDLLVGQ